MEIKVLILGFLFGAILQYASLNKYNVISGMATLENLTIAKAMAVAIGVGVIILNIDIGLGLATYHLKPILLTGIVLGGLIFGAGMAILGYCPGTMAISLGEGSLDALAGIIGGLSAGLLYTLIAPAIGTLLGPNLGVISLNTLIGTTNLFYPLIFLIGGIIIAVSFWLHKIDKTKNYKWLYSGIGLAIITTAIFSISDRPLGASTTFPYLADLITGTTGNEYFTKIQRSGNWEVWLLSGAFLAGLIISLLKRDFKITLIHSNWEKYKGTSAIKRVIWSFIGGFLLIFGARMAGGCTSGHIISGGMQLAISSLMFAVFVFAGLLITGKLFYKNSK
jgi:uncharacterized protein